MADKIEISKITNEEGTGIFDILMDAMNNHIKLQYEENRITGSNYATVYLGGMQAALASSIQFGLQEDLTEAQITGIETDNLIKEKQLEITDIELKTAYVDRIIKDKTAAKLGLDNAMRISEDEKLADDNHIYEPKYEE